MPLPALPSALALKSFFTSKKFLIPAAIIALLLAIGGGTYLYLNKAKDEAVEAAVTQADSQHTIRTYETITKVQEATVTVDVKMDKLRDQTIRDYSNVQNRIDTAPQVEREAPVAPLIIDTLNELDRLRALREQDDTPVG
jgi:GTP-binding protein EngB required for normal cell division